MRGPAANHYQPALVPTLRLGAQCALLVPVEWTGMPRGRLAVALGASPPQTLASCPKPKHRAKEECHVSKDIVRRTSQLDRIPRGVVRRVEAAHHRGLEAAGRERAAAYVAHVGMTLVAQLSAEEGALIQQVPLAEPRLKGIVDAFAIQVASEVMGMGF